MNILITDNNNNTFTVSVTVEEIGERGNEELIDTKVIKNYLISNNIKFKNCLKSSVVSNTGKLFGEWIFEYEDTKDPEKELDKQVKTQLKLSKSKKSLDKDKEMSD